MAATWLNNTHTQELNSAALMLARYPGASATGFTGVKRSVVMRRSRPCRGPEWRELPVPSRLGVALPLTVTYGPDVPRREGFAESFSVLTRGGKLSWWRSCGDCLGESESGKRSFSLDGSAAIVGARYQCTGELE